MNTPPEQPAQKTNRVAIVSILLGICSIPLFIHLWSPNPIPLIGPVFNSSCLAGLGMMLLTPAIGICGFLALEQITNHQKGRDLVITAFILICVEWILFFYLSAVYFGG